MQRIAKEIAKGNIHLVSDNIELGTLSIILTELYVDGSSHSMLSDNVTLPKGTAGQYTDILPTMKKRDSLDGHPFLFPYIRALICLMLGHFQ